MSTFADQISKCKSSLTSTSFVNYYKDIALLHFFFILQVSIMKETLAANLVRYRQGLGLTQEQLASSSGITRQSIINYESAKTLPDSKILAALAKALGVTITDLLRSPQAGLATFRFRSHTGFSQKPQFLTEVLRWLETYTNLEKAVGLQPYLPESAPVHQLEGNQERIKEAAKRFRLCLGVGEAPIANLFEVVEDLGLKVLRKHIADSGFFGVSACSDEQGAFVLINLGHEDGTISIERQLFTLAHEIGHLILHRGEYQENLVEAGTKEEEKEREKVADYFASYLLMSDTEFNRDYNQYHDVRSLKQHFRVSYKTVLYRLNELGIADYQTEQKKIYAIYKKKHGRSLGAKEELPPVLCSEDFPENERFTRLIWQALSLGKITELSAAELLGMTVEKLCEVRQEDIAYAV